MQPLLIPLKMIGIVFPRVLTSSGLGLNRAAFPIGHNLSNLSAAAAGNVRNVAKNGSLRIPEVG